MGVLPCYSRLCRQKSKNGKGDSTLHLKLIVLREKICAWEMEDDVTKRRCSGAARPFKRTSSLDKITSAELLRLPYTKKQLKSMEFIGKQAEVFHEYFDAADKILPAANYENVLKQTFGAESDIYNLYVEKAFPPKQNSQYPILMIDFEAINMRICGWYAQLIQEDGTVVQEYEGMAKPFSDTKMIRRLWKNTYSKLLTYDIDELVECKHIHSFKRYFAQMFSDAKKIYTYGDTDALFVKHTYGEEMFRLFKTRNVDMCVRLGNRQLSLEKTCHLFGIELDGDAHNPKTDVLRMKEYINRISQL